MVDKKALITIGIIIAGTLALVVALILLVQPYNQDRGSGFAFLSGIEPRLGTCFRTTETLRVRSVSEYVSFLEGGMITSVGIASPECEGLKPPGTAFETNELIAIPIDGMLPNTTEGARLAAASVSDETREILVDVPVVPASCEGVASSTVWIDAPGKYSDEWTVVPNIVPQDCAALAPVDVLPTPEDAEPQGTSTDLEFSLPPATTTAE